MPKKHILKFNQANPASVYSFEMIKTGDKWVETRAATDKYRKINAGDVLVFKCGKKVFKKKVLRVAVFKNIQEMLKMYKVTDIMPNKKSAAELTEAYFSYPNYESKIKEFGLIAFEI